MLSNQLIDITHDNKVSSTRNTTMCLWLIPSERLTRAQSPSALINCLVTRNRMSWTPTLTQPDKIIFDIAVTIPVNRFCWQMMAVPLYILTVTDLYNHIPYTYDYRRKVNLRFKCIAMLNFHNFEKLRNVQTLKQPIWPA